MIAALIPSLFALGFTVWSSAVSAQYQGPAIEACRAFAMKALQRDGTQAKTVVLERDASLSLEREAQKVGSQPVSSILTGNGAVVFEGAPSAELSFLCLLADEKRAVFFAWQARPNAPALSQCTRSDGLRTKAAGCLDLLLRVAEQDLAQVYAYRFQEANERGDKSLAAYRKANDEWREYRDAECTRRRELAPAGIAAEDYQAACMVELTRRRALDMR
jgi:uncharacterized protein YecT (DUF1311 family)